MNLKRILCFFLILLLLPVAVLSEDDEDEDLDVIELTEELPDDPPETLLATDDFYHTPNELSSRVCDHEYCFWKLEMGHMDEAAIWRVLTQPVTVLSGKQREQVRILARPEADCTDYTGVVTCASQAVHILERGDEWTLIEAYSSAEEGSAVKVFADHFEGWVRTSRLKEEEVDQTYGIVIDKLQQRLYVFREGKLFSTLLCSTGYVKDKKYFHETPHPFLSCFQTKKRRSRGYPSELCAFITSDILTAFVERTYSVRSLTSIKPCFNKLS